MEGDHRGGIADPATVVADFHIGDIALGWKPTPTISEDGISDPALQLLPLRHGGPGFRPAVVGREPDPPP